MKENKMKQPELFVDDHHGVYMGQIAWKQLASKFKKQARKALSKETIKSLEDGPESVWYCDACDEFTNIVFRLETGQKIQIQYADGGMWVIPFCFLRTKAANDFFGC
jgi:hypothetical protein